MPHGVLACSQLAPAARPLLPTCPPPPSFPAGFLGAVVTEYLWGGEAPLAHIGWITPGTPLKDAPWCAPARALVRLRVRPPLLQPGGLPCSCQWGWSRWAGPGLAPLKPAPAATPPAFCLRRRSVLILVGLLVATGLGAFSAIGPQDDDTI